MSDEEKRPSFVVLLMSKDGQPTGYIIKTNLWHPNLGDEENGAVDNDKTSFAGVFQRLKRSLEVYLRAVPFSLMVGQDIAKRIIGESIDQYVRKTGKRAAEKDEDNAQAFELDEAHFRRFVVYQSDMDAAMHTSKHLPKIMIIGLISAFDGFLSDLLGVIFRNKPEMVLTSEKEIKVDDLLKFNSIEEVKDSIIDKTVEDIMRQSHHDQFSWMESRFKMELRTGLHSLAIRNLPCGTQRNDLSLIH